ncbi:MAG: hypothetical protein HWN66_09190 [Candidatus Helarchaeota archaeon]|nr:hypothetical protein [Candidatus Helarchaeota archaeon]
MKLDWGKIPMEVPCPKCQKSLDEYENIKEDEWRFIVPRSPDPLQDYHECPLCHRVWEILNPHTDEIPLKK